LRPVARQVDVAHAQLGQGAAGLVQEEILAVADDDGKARQAVADITAGGWLPVRNASHGLRSPVLDSTPFWGPWGQDTEGEITNWLTNYLRMQCLAKSPASLAVHWPLSFFFMASHHSLLPTSGLQAATRPSARAAKAADFTRRD